MKTKASMLTPRMLSNFCTKRLAPVLPDAMVKDLQRYMVDLLTQGEYPPYRGAGLDLTALAQTLSLDLGVLKAQKAHLSPVFDAISRSVAEARLQNGLPARRSRVAPRLRTSGPSLREVASPRAGRILGRKRLPVIEFIRVALWTLWSWWRACILDATAVDRRENIVALQGQGVAKLWPIGVSLRKHLRGTEMPSDDDLRLLDLLDWWEGHRWAAAQLCSDESARLKAKVLEAVENLSVSELIFSSSEERSKIEEYIAQEIMCVEVFLTSCLAQEASGLSKKTATQASVTDYSGWSYWDLGRLALGGGAPSAIALAGGRAATSVLAAAGLATIAAPVTIMAALGGLAWSAYSTGEHMRTSYRDALMEGIDRCLHADPEASVLARHCAALDQIFNIKTGAA